MTQAEHTRTAATQKHSYPTTRSHLSQLNNRPGRYFKKFHDDDITILNNYGDNIHHKNVSSVRVFFQNVKGLTYSSSGEDYEYYLHNLQTLMVDIVGLAETNSPWQLFHLRSEFLQRVKKYHSISKTAFGMIDPCNDPVHNNDKFQSGGNITSVFGKWSTTIQKNEIIDPQGLGRWSGVTITGQKSKAISIITGYRSCKGHITTAGIGTTFHREYEFYRNKGIKSPNPRRMFLIELETVIKQLQSTGNAIIVMLDANEVLENGGAFADWVARLDLHDIHHHHPAPSTYIGSSDRRIDYIFGCHQIIEYVTSSGTLSYIDGPQSDHRSLFVDVNVAGYLSYDATLNSHLPAKARSLRTGNPELVSAYTNVMLDYYSHHTMEERMDHLFNNFHEMTREQITSSLESWDRDQGRAMKKAEKELQLSPTPYAWSPQLRNAALTRRYWKFRLREIKHNADYGPSIRRLQEQIQQNEPTFKFPFVHDTDLTIDAIRRHLTDATKQLHVLQKASSEHRFKSYQDLLSMYSADNNPVTRPESNRKAKIVKRTLRTERIRSMFRNIRTTIKNILPSQQFGINHIKVPRVTTAATQQDPDEFQAYIAQTPTNDIIWDTILDQATIEEYLLRYNRNSFRAAATSPCGHGLIYNSLSFTSPTPAAEKFLAGHIPAEWYGNDSMLREFLTEFMIPQHIRARTPIKSTLSEDDIIKGISKWKEATATSPSGRHLGHYKALIQDPTLLKCFTQFMYVAVKTGTSVSRWARATNVMLEKDAGNPCIHRLRIIHLFEADFNLYMKMQWGKRLVRRASKHTLLNTGQYGSVPNRTALEPILLTQLTNDNCRILRRNMARFDNDASACFDRIIVPLAMLAARRCGMPDQSIRIHAETLQKMEYAVKTQFGTSTGTYTGSKEEPLFGTGQGSGASPAAWLSLVVILMNTMDKLISERVSFQSPDNAERHSRLIDAFVDDTSISFNTDEEIDMATMVHKITNIASCWNRLLHYSGGALNLQKCAYHITMWEWKHGRPILRTPQIDDPAVRITSMSTATEESIKYQPYDKASRLLGVYISPNGDYSSQIELLKHKADTYAARIQSPRIKPDDVVTFLRTTYSPAMSYVLPCIAADEEELHIVQTKLLSVALQKMGLSSKTPVPLRHGPIDMGGMGLIDLRTEMGVLQLKTIRNAIYANSEVGKLIIISIKYSQIEAGIKEHLLENPAIDIPYLTPTWITSVRQFLFQHNLTLTFTNSLQIHLQGSSDQHIMQPLQLKKYSPQDQRDINLVRLYIQAITLSDVSTPDGNHITWEALHGHRALTQVVRKNWPRQRAPTKHQSNVWKRYMVENFLRYNTTWKTPLGEVLPNTYETYKSWRNRMRAATFDDPRGYSTLRQYIRSLPRWYRRLLDGHKQLATTGQIWKAFRRKSQTIDIASDGGLSGAIGTFGWKIVAKFGHRDEVLFQGAGPIDGPHEVGSSTRSELGGFTAPLLLVTAVAKFWGIRHKCRFRWYTDSQSAISKVRVYTVKGKSTRRYPEHSDYMMVIQELSAELNRPIAACWVKGHQDEERPYDELSREAKLNVDVDELATKQHDEIHRRPPMRSIDHLPCQKISITINGQRFPSNWDTNVRWSINGTYMKQYLTKKHGWEECTWKSIDFSLVKAYIPKKDLSAKTKWFKFMHNLQSVGTRKQQMSNSLNPDINIAQCPCCNNHPETQQHMVLCDHNPNRTAAHTELHSGGSTYKENHNLVLVLTDCIEQWLFDPTINPSITSVSQPTLEQYSTLLPLHMMDTLQEAITEQNSIGWMNLLRGFFSAKWRHLASSHMSNPDPRAVQPAEGRRRMGNVLQRVQGFIQQLWIGRNEALHKHDKFDEEKFLSLEAAEIRHYFTQPHLLPVQDQHYCQGQVLTILRGRPSYRRRWLMRVRRARAALLNDQLRQARITTYFPRLRPHPSHAHIPSTTSTHTSESNPTHDPSQKSPRDVSTIGRHSQRPTSQTRLHHFFPGRPPDMRSRHSTISKSHASK